MIRIRHIEIAVGFFIVLSVASLLVLALQVSDLELISRPGQGGYTVKAYFSNVGGLKSRGKVVMAGVTVGRVTGVALDPKTYEAVVSMEIIPSFNNIPVDSKLGIMTSGLLGDNFIGITPGFSNEYLKEGDKISIENTDSALLLENLISKFLSSQTEGKP